MVLLSPDLLAFWSLGLTALHSSDLMLSSVRQSHGCMTPWSYSPMDLLTHGLMMFCFQGLSYGLMVLWSYGRLVLWSHGGLVLWSHGLILLVLWACLLFVLRSCGPMLSWSHGLIVFCTYGLVVLRSCLLCLPLNEQLPYANQTNKQTKIKKQS